MANYTLLRTPKLIKLYLYEIQTDKHKLLRKLRSRYKPLKVNCSTAIKKTKQVCLEFNMNMTTSQTVLQNLQQ
jgi:hypothetical protein